MDYMEEDDELMDGMLAEDFGGAEEAILRRGERRGGRGTAGPAEVAFSVFLPTAPRPGQAVMLTGTLPELGEGVAMEQCDTGGGRLWRASLQLYIGATAAAAAGLGVGLGVGAPGASGGLFGLAGLGSAMAFSGRAGASGAGGELRGGAVPTLFEVMYIVKNADGQVALQEDMAFGEPAPPRSHYFHRARFSGADAVQDEAFPLFVHDEVHLLQSGATTPREFIHRFQHLAQAPFARKRSLLDKALEELIQVHWGEDARPPASTVLAIAATLGYFRRRQSHDRSSFAMHMYEDQDMLKQVMPASSSSQEKEKEPPQSLVVCRWIVKHCPSRQDAPEDEAERRERGEGMSNHHLQRLTQTGVLQAAETLYKGEKTFEWLKLLNFLPEHGLPGPLSASTVTADEQQKLVKSFLDAMDKVFENFRTELAGVRRMEEGPEKAREETRVNSNLELFLRGLTTFSPSADGLHKLILKVTADHASMLEVVMPMVFHRFRSLHFGENDKEALKAMLRDIPFIHSDDCVISLLQSQHHPNEAFQAKDIVQFIKLATETKDGVRSAGPALQSAMRRWLMRLYGRPPQSERPERKEEKLPLSKLSKTDYLAQKEEIRDAIRKAIRAWHMVLALPCFKQEEESLRIINFELSQAYFFKDPDPVLVLDCMLDLESDIKAVSTVKQLELELHRIAIKSVRDAQDYSETEHADELLRLLFDTPTPFRFVIIESFFQQRGAATDLGKILSNEPMWSRLLSPVWMRASMQEFPLHATQSRGQHLLQLSAQQLGKGTIELSTLHTILQHQQVYEKLVTQVVGSAPSTIPQSAEKLHKFDDEFKHLRVYVKLYCAAADVECGSLEALIADINNGYEQMELQVAAAKLEGLPVRPHLAWLHSLQGSDVFAGIWKVELAQGAAPKESQGGPKQSATCARPGCTKPPRNGQPGEYCGRACEQQALAQSSSQAYVVSSVIPRARATWERLAKSVETGTATLKDIRWCVELEWIKVQRELQLLERTAPKSSTWVAKAEELAKAMRLATKLRELAPSLLHLQEVLVELFRPAAEDACVAELKDVVKKSEHMWEMPLGKMVDHVAPYRATISILPETTQDYTITMAKHEASLKWLLRHKSTPDFNRLISLCRPNTDDPLILASIASLTQTRTFLADVLYSKPPYANLSDFLKELAALVVDETVHGSLTSVQAQYDPMVDLLTTHSRTPGVQACYELKKISEQGHFHVKCTQNDGELLVCQVGDDTQGYEFLAELRRQLLMTDVPAELDGELKMHEMLEAFVDKFQLLEQYGRCAMELFSLGHFAYHEGQRVLTVQPKDTVALVQDRLRDLQQRLSDWQTAVDDARGSHYYLNYFTVRELCHLVESVPQISKEPSWASVWPLLRCVDAQADAASMRKQVQAKWADLDKRVLSVAANKGSEVVKLNALGQLLDSLFKDVKPIVHHLDGLKPVRMQLQGDLLIRSMQNRENGTPIFVCNAEDNSKVTELVLSIYTRRERVPEAEELLLCSARTTVEEIELLLRRFFSARRHKREERLYCVGNVHLLPYVVQCGTVEALRRLEEKHGFEHASALVFVTGQTNQMLTNALNRHNIAVSVLPRESLMEAVARAGEKYHGRQLEAVTAWMNGVGKTHYILRRVFELQEKYKKKPLLHHVEIRETTNISGLVRSLLDDPTDPKGPTAIHIDMAHILPSHVDTLIFELLIVGMLRDPQNCAVYHRRAIDFFLVELPNTPGEATARQLSFCLLLPRTYLRMGSERIDAETPKLIPVGRAFTVEFERNKMLDLVGKSLAAMRVEAFNPKSKDFNQAWTAASVPAIDPRRVYELLSEVCCSETSPPSFLVFTNFIRFLGNLVQSAEDWNMMNLNLLQSFDPGLKHFKHCFFRLIIETSRDFALRQVPKAVDNEVSPLEPRPAAGAAGAGGGGGAGSGGGGHVGAAAEGNGGAAVEEKEEAGLGRVDVSAYVKRFDQMPSWESCVHPVASFKKNEAGFIIGCNIMSLQRNFLGNFIDRNLQNSLNLNDLKLEKDWSKVTHQEAVQQVHLIEGGELLKKKDHVGGPTEYVVTVDNLLKLMSIQQRLKYGLPVILMGETGCGKTALVRFLAKTLDFKLLTLDIHGGITDETIMTFMDKAIVQGEAEPRGVLVFFDEINAANCMALFKTIIIDRMYGNRIIPGKVRIISCCNPYRLRRNDEMEAVALVFQHQQGATTGITDPMKRLVYRVHPLPESLIDVVSDFGALSERSEELYVDAILRKELPKMEGAGEDVPGTAAGLAPAGDSPDGQSEYDVFVNAFKELLCQSQVFVREVNDGERSVVSMRDIARAARVFKWFLTYYSKLRGVASLAASDDKDGAMRIQLTAEMLPHLRSAVILTLGYCYHSRLSRDQRWGYRKRLCDTWQRMRTENPRVEWLRFSDAADLEAKLTETQYEFVSQMDLGEGIALNEALRENLFMLLVSIMNQIPILLIGKPGCSKSLAMGVLQSNLNGEVSSKEFFKTMPAVEVFPYQCSPLSTPEAILNAFHSARQSNLGHKSTIVCVLLDEVGLAEESPHLPLKVLHRELEDLQGIACVGISNWALDAAKMSRCVTLYRPPPTVEDLCVTAEGMVASANLKGYLRALSEAFFEVYKTQRRADFWGMREFYSTVRVINAELKLRAARGQEAVLEPHVLMKTVQRNFGGQPEGELEQCIEEFFERVGMGFEQVQRFSTTALVQQNLEEPDARHLMLLTKNNAALRLLFESGLLDHGKAEVMFGSTFPNDQSDVFVAMNLQRIKSFMQQPISLVMVHCDSFYESLYDLLNQHYMEYGGTRYVKIAHGSKSKQCPIHRLFRVIVITEISDAYFRLAPPLLNRFEKQIFLRKDLMSKGDEALRNRLAKFWEQLLECVREAGIDTREEEEDLAGGDLAEAEARGSNRWAKSPRCRPIAGYHPELLSSLVFTLRRQHSSPGATNDNLYEEARRMLTWVLTPEAVCIAATCLGAHQMHMKFGFDLVDEYFHRQHHSDLPSYAEGLLQDQKTWCDNAGAQVMVMTYSPILGKIGSDLQKVVAPATTTEISLHELSSSIDIEKAVGDFYAEAAEKGGRRFLLIHADPAAASLRMIEHSRFVCEKQRSSFLKRHAAAASKGEGVFVVLVVHLQRGIGGTFSFDFDSQWRFVFLDSVEPAMDLNSMPSLGSMLNMPLIEVVQGLDFPKMLKGCFRSALSRLIYPHSRNSEDLQRQIQQILIYLEDAAFGSMVRGWVLRVLEQTPKNFGKEEEGTVGDDKNWFAAIAAAAHELTLAGTFRAALHNRVTVIVSSLLTVLLAHLDKNGGLALLSQGPKRDLWLSLANASLTSPLSVRLHNEAVTALSEAATAQHEVGTDALTGARPFGGSFPSSWFVSRSIDGLRHIVESLPLAEQLSALTAQYQLSKLYEVNLDPVLDPVLLDDYIADFSAMHLDWTERVSRVHQQRILKKSIARMKGAKLVSLLEVHQLFWLAEKQIAYCISLLNAVPAAEPAAEKLIETVDARSLNLELLLLVHTTLTGELQAAAGSKAEGSTVSSQVHAWKDFFVPAGPPILKNDSSHDHFYREWLQRKAIVAGLTREFFASLTPEQAEAHGEKLQRLESDAEPRMETLSLFLQHVAYPLRLPRDVVTMFVAELPTGKIRHARTLLAILKVAQSIAKSDNALSACGAFIESWMLDVCLRDAEATSDLEESCLRLFCNISVGLPVVLEPNTSNGVIAGDFKGWSEQKEVGIAALPNGAGTIPRSKCLNLALLRKLTVRSEGGARRVAMRCVEELLREVSAHERHNDTTFATKYAVLCEEAATVSMQRLAGPLEWPDMSMPEVFKMEKDTSPAKMLQEIGRIRWMISRYAAELCKEPVDLELNDVMVKKLDPLLRTTDERLAPLCRSMRIYLLKCVERQRGVSFLRGLLATKPVCGADWVEAWKNLHDIDFEKFIGAALVPKWNPFCGQDATPEYNTAKVAVLEMMNSTSTAKLDQFARECQSNASAQQRKDVAGLLMALCQEPGLHAALEEEDRRPPWRQMLHDWLQQTPLLPVSTKERVLLRIFAGDDELIRSLSGSTASALGMFSVRISPRMDDLLKWRWLGHYASVLLAAPPCSILSCFRKIMLDPIDLVTPPQPFIPSMDEDIRNRVMKALLERGENIWKFKSHWYKCTCGYTFFIGECGRPMEVTACPGCSIPIGGNDHNKTTATEEDDESDRSPWGYMLPPASKDEKHISYRELPTTSARAVRLLLHGAMLVGVVAHIESPMPRVFDEIVNKDVGTCTLHHEDEASYLAALFGSDWQHLVENLSSNGEDLAAALHNLLRNMHVEKRDDPKGIGAAAAAPSGGDLSWERLNLQARNSLEETAEAKYLSGMVQNYDKVQEILTRWSGAEEDGKFVAELKEAADVRDFPERKREAELPQLWAYRSPVTLDALHMRLAMERRSQEVHPVLTTVLSQPLYPVLKALGLLSGVFEWHGLVASHFSGRITRAQASVMKVGQVLSSLPPADAVRWERAYRHFESAWHIAWPYVERFECTELTDNLKQVRVSRDSEMVWCIADQQGEGICPLALTQWLVERHNELVQVVSAAVGFPARKVSSRLLGQHDVVIYDGDELMRFLRSRCVTYGVGGKLNFDFLGLEQQLQRELSRPEITIELRAFQWLGESFSAVSELRSVIKQKELPPETVERLKAELSSTSVAHACLQKVQMSTAFILKSGGALSGEQAGEMRLAEYLRSILSESGESLPSKAAQTEVHLWHVDAFAKLLRQMINKDPMDSIDPKYKVEVPEELKALLVAAKPDLPNEMLEWMGTFAETRLVETWIGANVSMVETLKAIREELAVESRVFDAVQLHLPAGLQMQHWGAVYKILRDP